MLIAFDVDGTLIDAEDQPRDDVIALLRAACRAPGTAVIVWSGGGQDYAQMWGRRLKLPKAVEYMAKDKSILIDLAFDDSPEFKLATCIIVVHQHEPWEIRFP